MTTAEVNTAVDRWMTSVRSGYPWVAAGSVAGCAARPGREVTGG
jgi:hypothetical protein